MEEPKEDVKKLLIYNKEHRKEELARLVKTYNLGVHDIIAICKVSETTARRWIYGAAIPHATLLITLRRACEESPLNVQDAMLKQLEKITELLQNQPPVNKERTADEIVNDMLFGKKKRLFSTWKK